MIPRLLTAQPQRNMLKPENEIAPVMGMDGTVPLTQMRPGVAVYLYNLLPSEYGCRTRPGYLTWAQNLDGGAVHTIFPFNSQVLGGADNRLFCATQNGIYNISAQGEDNPAAVVTFPTQSADAGYISFLHHTDPSGNQVLLIADSANGMYEYNPVGGVWTKYTTEITGVDPTQVAFIMLHKGRIWMIERNASDAWYLPIGARAGAASRFQFGSKMQYGGFLVGLYNWSQDGGDGVDDYLVGVSKGGDVMIFRGRDPDFADAWDMVGIWFIGKVPENRRVGTETGGDTLLLSIFGVTSVSVLMAGVDPTKVSRNVTAKISRFVGDAIRNKIDDPYWEIKPLREENLMIINSPKAVNERNIQYALNINRLAEESGGGWALMRDVPATTWESYNAETFFGTEDGRVCRLGGSLDNVDIAGGGGIGIEFSGLGRFTNYGDPRFKQVQYMRPAFIATNLIEVDVLAVYDFVLIEPTAAGSVSEISGPLWDVSIWDQAFWSGFSVDSRPQAATGYGRSVAVAWRGSTISRATLVNTELAWMPWDFL